MPRCVSQQNWPPRSAQGQTRSFGDVSFSVCFARKRTRLDDLSTHPNLILVVDVRGPNAFGKGHVKGAINIPHREMTATRMAEYPKDKVFVVYCADPHCNGGQQGGVTPGPARLAGKDDDRRHDWLDRRRFYIDALVTLAVATGIHYVAAIDCGQQIAGS